MSDFNDRHRKLFPLGLIIGGIVAIYLIGFIIYSFTKNTKTQSGGEYYDKTSGEEVLVLTGAVMEVPPIFGFNLLDDGLPDGTRESLQNDLERLVNYLYPGETFSYKKNSLSVEGNQYNFKIASNKHTLSVTCQITNSTINSLEIKDGKSIIYRY